VPPPDPVHDEQRRAYVARRLDEALDRPLTAPGSELIARSVLERFTDVDLLANFAEKALETLSDGRHHNRIAISASTPHAAVAFVAWSGTHREVQPERYGRYLGALAATAKGLVDQGTPLAGFLEIDAYLRESVDPAPSGEPLEGDFEVDVEFSYLPGLALGFPQSEPNPLPQAVVLNRDLCSPEEAQSVAKLMP
jgi:hypothetical protein